jgi:hypothetical protein
MRQHWPPHVINTEKRDEPNVWSIENCQAK